MSSRINCPSCNSALAITPAHQGKKIKCPKCQTVLEVPVTTAGASDPRIGQDKQAVAAANPSSARLGAAGPPALPRQDDDGIQDRPSSRSNRRDDDEDDDRPSRRSRRDEEDEDDDDRPRRRSRHDDDDDDDDDRPRRRSRRDEEDEDDDRPRRKGRRDEEDEDDDDRPRRKSGDDDDEDRSKKSKKKEIRAGMRSVNTGLVCFWFKYLFLVICFSIFASAAALSNLLFTLSPRVIDTLGALFFILYIIGLLSLVTALVMGIVGGCFYLGIPSKTGFKGMAIATLIMECVVPACFTIFLIVAWSSIWGRSPEGMGAALVFYILVPLCWLGGLVVFMLLMRGTALYLKDKRTGADCLTTMIATLCIAVGVPLVGGLLWYVIARTSQSGVVALVLMMLLIATWSILMIVMFLRIMNINKTLQARI